MALRHFPMTASVLNLPDDNPAAFPMDEASFKQKLNEIIGAYTMGKDASTMRIVVKSKESEE